MGTPAVSSDTAKMSLSRCVWNPCTSAAVATLRSRPAPYLAVVAGLPRPVQKK